MPIVTRKSKVAFPEIGQLRKGSAKQDKVSQNGKKYQTFGKDLGQFFRPVFFPGNEDTAAKFVEIYNEQPVSVIVTLAFDEIDQVWDNWYEAYTAGRMVARTDGEKFIYWVDTKTGERKVVNGEPYTPWIEDMPVGTDYRGNPVFAKEVGRLKVVIPALMRMAYFTVPTTSKYDCAHITEILNGLKERNHGRLAGIPLMLRRRPYEVTWAKDDGSAQRVTKWLINLEPDPEWVERMWSAMQSYALPMPGDTLALPGGVTAAPIPEDQVNPDDVEEDPDWEIEGEFEDAEEERLEREVEGEYEEAEKQLSKPEEQKSDERPFNLAQLKSALTASATKKHAGKKVSKERQEVAAALNFIFMDDDKRHAFQSALCGKESLTKVDDAYVIAMWHWLNPAYDKNSAAYYSDKMAEVEAKNCYAESLKANGQQMELSV